MGYGERDNALRQTLHVLDDDLTEDWIPAGITRLGGYLAAHAAFQAWLAARERA